MKTSAKFLFVVLVVGLLNSCAPKNGTSVSPKSSCQNGGARALAGDTAQATCGGDHLFQQVDFAGFCVSAIGSVKLSAADAKFLSQKLLALTQKFPNLFASVLAKGYQDIVIQPGEVSEHGGAVLGEILKEGKQIGLYSNFFSAERENPVLDGLGFSLSNIIIMHEMMHAFDDDTALVQSNLKMLGWDRKENAPGDGFVTPDVAGIANLWVTNGNVSAIKSDLGPRLASDGPFVIYVEARKRMLQFGYPSIYSVLNGPLETFAELGAYIALDPSAASYVPAPTLAWFRDNVLN